ncbi:hypothetical protein Tco_1561608 [Tanacetum coccineum]
MNISSILEVIKPTFKGRLKRACKQISYLETPIHEKGLKSPYLICDICEGTHEADECDRNNLTKQVWLSGGDIYDDLSLLRFYQNDDIPSWGNSQRNEEGEGGPEWVVRSKFEDELSNFMLEKKFHTKEIGEMLDQYRKGIHKQFSQILTMIGKGRNLKPEKPTFAITTRSGTSTRDPPFPTPSQPITTDHAGETTEKEGQEGEEPNIIQNVETPQSPTFYHPSKSSSVPFPSL